MEAFMGHLTVFVLASFVGWQIVWKVALALHTPLMSVANAISGIIVVGLMLAAGYDTDVALVLGANDIANTDALEQPGSPIYGMPILEAHKARIVMVVKRSLNPGFSGIDNPLFYRENTMMVFGDARAVVEGMVKELKGAAVE
ncbi:MAG: NAD(P)(+) transhydrogenase (Re/Si-specific) subunit beta [Gemmatimonadota bacterium]